MADKIFPLIDRRAPLLSKLRVGDAEESFADMGERIGKELGAITKIEDQERADEAHEEVVHGIIRGVALSTGLEEDDVDYSFAEKLADGLFNERKELLEDPEEFTLEDLEEDDDDSEEE